MPTGIQIGGITVTSNTPIQRPNVLLINGKNKRERRFDAGESKLRWDFEPALWESCSAAVGLPNFDDLSILRENSDLTIRLQERRPLLPNVTVAECSISFDKARSLMFAAADSDKEHKLRSDPDITIRFISSDSPNVDTLRIASGILSEHKSVLDHIGRSRKFLESLLRFGAPLAELEPTTKVILGCVNAVYKHLEAEEQFNKSILDLIESIACTLGYVEDVEQFARLHELKRAIRSMEPLVEDTTKFIVGYVSRAELAKTALSFLSSSDSDQVTTLKSRFDHFKQRFDRGVAVQSASTVEQALAAIVSNQDDIVVAKLKPDGLESGSQVAECLEGTRRDILAKIHEWMTDFDSPNILWVKGHPGVGKSAIASSLVEELRDSMRLGSNFFFRREKAAVMSPNSLWRTVASDLARQYPTVRSRLVAALKEDETILSTVNSDKLFHQLIVDPLKASEGIPIGRLPIVVIDALDECGGLEGQQSKDRKSLMRTIKSWSGLPARFKLVVTGRGESDIERLFSNTRNHLLEVFAGQMVNEQSSKDISNFLIHQFRQIVAQYPGSLPPDWPGTQTIDQLTNTAAGLFIWADTVTKFVELGEPQEQLRLILNGNGTDNMTTLYLCILNTSFTKPSERVKNAFQSIVGMMIFAKVPLSTSSIARLLSHQSSEMDYILNGLQSVIDRQGSPRVSHQSFVDFLIDPARCPQDFLIEPERDNKEIALACLRVMKEELRFNICNIGSSYLRNVDIPDLPLCAEKCITPHLAYSSQFWANHLTEAAFGVDILGHIQYFMDNQFLFWLEVLSITKRVSRASSMLLLLIAWIQPHGLDNALAFAADMKKFASMFAMPISQSAAHIYLSALPFSPRSSIVRQRYIPDYGHALTFQTGGLSHWPTIHSIFSGHRLAVQSVAFSPDGTRIVSGSQDGTVRVWDATTGEVVAGPFEGHNGMVNSVAFSPDGTRIAAGSGDRTVRVWDTVTGDVVIGSFNGSGGIVHSVAFSPDGTCIASGSNDRRVRVCDTVTGELVAGPFKGHARTIYSVAFSPDGTRIASGSGDRTIRVWDAVMGELVAGPFKGHKNRVTSVAFSPDGIRIASGSWDRTVRVWDAVTGEVITGTFIGHDWYVNSVAFSADGTRVVSGSEDFTIRVWDAFTGEVVAGPFEGHDNRVYSAAFSPDGTRIVSGSHDSTVRVWDVAMGKAVARLFKGHDTAVSSVSFSPDGTRIASGSYDSTVGVWDAVTGERVATAFVGRHCGVYSVAFSSDGKRIVSGSEDNMVRVWDAITGQVIAGPFEGHKNRVTFVVFSADGTRIASGSWDRTVRVWDAVTGEVVAGPFEGHGFYVTSVTFSPDGTHIVSGSFDGIVRVWGAVTGEVIAGPFKAHNGPVNSVAFSPDGMRIASGSSDCTVRVWDTVTGEAVTGPFEGHHGSVNSVAFSPDGTRVVSGSDDETVRVWDAVTGELAAGPFEGHDRAVLSVAFSPDGIRIVSGSRDMTIRVWDALKHDASKSNQNSASFTHSSKLKDGWIMGSNSELLFWVPPTLRTGLVRPGNALIIGNFVITKLDLEKFAHGESWSRCKDGGVSRSL